MTDDEQTALRNSPIRQVTFLRLWRDGKVQLNYNAPEGHTVKTMAKFDAVDGRLHRLVASIAELNALEPVPVPDDGRWLLEYHSSDVSGMLQGWKTRPEEV